MNETVDLAKTGVAEPTRAPSPHADPPPRRRRGGLRLFVALVLAVVALVAFERWEKLSPGTVDAGKAPEKTGAPPQTIRAASAERGDMPLVIDALGAVTPLASVTVKTQIAGRLMSFGVQEGQLVKTGDFIAQVDSRPYEAALAQVQAQLAKDTATYNQAQADLARYQTLSRQDSIARQQVDDQVFLVAQTKATIGVDQAQIDTAKLNLAYTRIVSPIAGRIGLRLVDAGNYVQPGDASGLLTITQLDPISIVFSTPEDNLPRIAPRVAGGAQLPVTAFDRANVKTLGVGVLTAYDNVIDTTTGTFKLRASFANREGALFPSQFVNVRLLVDTVKNAVLVPNAAVQIGQSGPFAYVVKDEKTVEVRKIKTEASDSQRTIVSQGLEAGESVVVDGVDRLRDGAAVRMAGAKPDAGGEAPKPRRKRDKDAAAP